MCKQCGAFDKERKKERERERERERMGGTREKDRE